MPEALLLITPSCPHCSTMMSLLGDLLKEGRIGHLSMVNINEQSDEAAKYNVCSVPWLKLGSMEFTGAHSITELENAIDMSTSEDGQQRFLFEQLKNGRLDDVIEIIERDNSLLPELMELLKGKEAPMAVQIGVSAILDGYEDNPSVLKNILPVLLELSEASDETIRADACHYLSLEGSVKAMKRFHECKKDSSAMVRDVVGELVEN